MLPEAVTWALLIINEVVSADFKVRIPDVVPGSILISPPVVAFLIKPSVELVPNVKIDLASTLPSLCNFAKLLGVLNSLANIFPLALILPEAVKSPVNTTPVLRRNSNPASPPYNFTWAALCPVELNKSILPLLENFEIIVNVLGPIIPLPSSKIKSLEPVIKTLPEAVIC